MRVFVLGATGGTGMEIVRRAIERGHEVTAFVRSPEKLGALADDITVKQGNLLDTDELADALVGQDAVLSAFGPRVPIAKNEEHLLEEFATALIPAMVQARVQRVLVESSAFLFKGTVLPPAHLLGRLFFPTVVRDATAMEEAFRKSELRWTMLRPPRLTDGQLTGRYRERCGRLPAFGFSISRADVADYFLKALDGEATVGKIIGLSK